MAILDCTEHSQRKLINSGQSEEVELLCNAQLDKVESIRLQTQAEGPEEEHQTSKATPSPGSESTSVTSGLSVRSKRTLRFSVPSALRNCSSSSMFVRKDWFIGLSNSCQRVGSQRVFSSTLTKLGVFKSPKP